MTEPIALDLRDHVLFDVAQVRLRPIAASGSIRLDLLCLEPKQDMPATVARGDRLYTVIGGRAWAVVEDAQIVLEPLQSLLVPDGSAHGLRNDSADPLIVQVVSTVHPDGAPTHPRAQATFDADDGDGTAVGPMPAQSSAPGSVSSSPEPGRRRLARLRRILGSHEG